MSDEIKKYTEQEAIDSGIKYFFNNQYGWSNYFTTVETWCTPSGKLWNQGFPKIVKVENGTLKATKKQSI